MVRHFRDSVLVVRGVAVESAAAEDTPKKRSGDQLIYQIISSSLIPESPFAV